MRVDYFITKMSVSFPARYAVSQNIAGFNVFYGIEQYLLYLNSENEGLNCQLHLSRYLPRVNDRRTSPLLTRIRALN